MSNKRWMRPEERAVEAPFLAVFRNRFHAGSGAVLKFRYSADERAAFFLDGEKIADGPRTRHPATLVLPLRRSAARAVWRYLTPDVQLTRGVAGAKADTLADDVQAAFRKTADGYFYEVAFSPKSVEPFRLKAGNTIGIGILLNDADDPAQQEPRSRLANTIGTDMPNERPDFWPLIRLIE